ncbi:MAG TPA: HDOD domain-containing protein [Pseudomonadales bacterium]
MPASESASGAASAPRPWKPYPNPPADQRVRAVIMEDGAGEIQVLMPEQALLDLAALRAVTGRALRARPYRVEEPVPALPGACGLPVVIDSSLLQAERLALGTSDPGAFVQARGADLLNADVEVQSGAIAQRIGPDPTPKDRSADGSHIGSTLSRFTAERMQARLDQTLHIPPLPEAARRIVALQADPDYDLADLVQIIETDPSIAARIMGWANSAFYSPKPPATTIDDAVMRVLGFDTVMSMALGMALGQTLRLPESHVRGLPGFWLEAVFTAAAMEALARQMPRATRPLSGLCYLTGLLANFGTLVVGHVFPHQYATICAMQEANRHLPHTYVDQYVLQMPREVLTAALLECWSLPSAVTDSVRFQYVADYEGENITYVRLLRLARQLLGTQGLTDQPPELPDPAMLDALGLEEESLRAVLKLLNESSAQLDELAGSLTR